MVQQPVAEIPFESIPDALKFPPEFILVSAEPEARLRRC